MVFILESIRDPDEIKKRFKVYNDYLRSIKEYLPLSAFTFATAHWHYDPMDHKCPHDSWVESLNIRELSSGERLQVRELEIKIQLLGAYQDGHINLSYKNVQSYSLTTPVVFASPALGIGHGDWLVDEIRLSERGFVVHEITFSRGSNWLIECSDISYEWIPFES